jgi:hypothetical protein
MQKSAIIEYNHDGYLCEGFADWDDASATRPGILVFPEWVGVGEYTHARPDCKISVVDVFDLALHRDLCSHPASD